MSNVTAPAAGAVLAAAQLPDGSNAFKQLIVDSAGAEVIGAVDANPGATTLLGRLKAIAGSLVDVVTGVAATASADRIVAITASDSTALNPVPKALVALTAGNVALKGTDAAAVTVPVVAGQLLPLRARYVMATGTTATVAALI